MREQGYRIEPLKDMHDRAGFSCGTSALETYLQRHARQDADRGLAAVYILTRDGTAVAGFYTLSAFLLEIAHLPPDLAKRLPRRPVPATLLGRMAVSSNLQRQGLGRLLLLDALSRAASFSGQIGSWAMVVDAKQGARDFYLRYGFQLLPSSPDRLFLTMRIIKSLGLPEPA